jgi:predicted unusual protein kinase regulating ubiquinone biosynthesis (AarF/ABC1/UbiB family)
MTLQTPSDLQFSLLEFIAHLTADDYEKVPQDLVNLQFLKEEKLGLMVEAGLLEPLFYFLRQSNKGGGGSKVRERIYEEYSEKYPGADEDELRVYMRAEMQSAMEENAAKVSAVTGITTKVEDLQKQNADSFGIPEWFLYTSRAFLTLEGISLQADSDYSIIQSCFPYVAKRLIGDASPRSQAALRDLIYGKDDQLNTEK